jgi:uncharacterized protein (UPF0212 family)
MSDTPTNNEPKAGYKTTEFWLAAAASIVGLLFAADIFPAESQGEKLLGLAGMVLTSLGYTVSRTMVKK